MDRFEIGEIAEALYITSGIWVDCEIMSEAHKSINQFGHMISIPMIKSQRKDGWWHCDLKYLRKKKPPEMGSLDELEKITQWGDKPGYRPKPNKIVVDPSKPVVPHKIEQES